MRKDIEDRLKGSTRHQIEDKWNELKEAMTVSAVKVIGYNKGQVAKKPWVTAEMLEKMDERRSWKSNGTEEGTKRYRKLNNELRRETQKAKEKWWETECEELEELDRKGRQDLVYAKVRHLTTKKKTYSKTSNKGCQWQSTN